ncbi:MAG: hypothetical protein QE487_11675 [Fluviicola sp.]|nr:hypothetical protein [Fluviicola sp.]
MYLKLSIIILAFFSFSLNTINAQVSATSTPMPLVITPCYNYDPLQIETEDYSAELKSLSLDNYDSLATLFSAKLDSVSITSLFIFSVRLYDLGKKDEAVYWFHSAKIRAGVFIKSLDPEKTGGIGSLAFELKQQFIAFSQLAGEYINGYAGGELDKWVETLQKVKLNIDNLNAFSQYPSIVFLDEEGFKAAKQNRIEDCEKLIEYIKKNKKEIKKTRKENGIEGKY